MNSLNRLGLVIGVITIGFVLLAYGIYWGVRSVFQHEEPQETVVAIAPSTTEAPATDKDNDGLPDLVENVYATNPDLPDTDADGTNDGQEITAGRNPLQKGPNDSLQDVPLAEAVTDINTYTGRYLASLPADLSREDVLNKSLLEAFVNENKGELLPRLPAGTLLTSEAEGKEAISNYLDGISSTTNPAIVLVSNSDIEVAFRTTYANSQDPALSKILTSLKGNFAALQEIAAPKEVLQMHTSLLSATQALINNVTLLQNMPKDFVGGLIGAKNIELLGPIFTDIGAQVEELEKKYEIE